MIHCPLFKRSVVEGTPRFVHESSPLVGHFFVLGLRRLRKGVHVTLAINGSGILEVGRHGTNEMMSLYEMVAAAAAAAACQYEWCQLFLSGHK